MASANTEGEIHSWLAFPNSLALLQGLHAQPVTSKAAIIYATVSLWISSPSLTGMLSSPNKIPLVDPNSNSNIFFPVGHGQRPITSAWRPWICWISYGSYKVDIGEGLYLSWNRTVDNYRCILCLNLGLFPQYSVVTSQRIHFFFCNPKVKIIQGRFR